MARPKTAPAAPPASTPAPEHPTALDPINEGSDLIREARWNLRARGISGDELEAAIAELWRTRSK